MNLLELVSAYAPFANGGNGVWPTASPRSATAPAMSSTAAPAPGRAGSSAPNSSGEMNEMLSRGHRPRHRAKCRRAAAPRRRQDRHDPGLPRRLVHRLHRRSRRRGVVRQRRQHADEQGDRRLVAGGCLARFHAGGDAVRCRSGRCPRGAVPQRNRRHRRSAGRGLLGSIVRRLFSPAPHPSPLPAGGERERGDQRAISRLSQRRERGRDDQHVLLLDEHAAGGGRPAAVLAGFFADAGALVRVLIGPDVDPLV